MSIRYVNLLSAWLPQVEVYSNRGTSGIDGSTSTALGVALASPGKLNILITGDLAFFYDRNAFWNNYLPSNFLIILLNNHGGGIFGLIDGPSRQPELEEFFITPQKLKAENLAREYGLEYDCCLEAEELKIKLKNIFSLKKSALLEVETNRVTNQEVFNYYKNKLTEI